MNRIYLMASAAPRNQKPKKNQKKSPGPAAKRLLAKGLSLAAAEANARYALRKAALVKAAEALAKADGARARLLEQLAEAEAVRRGLLAEARLAAAEAAEAKEELEALPEAKALLGA